MEINILRLLKKIYSPRTKSPSSIKSFLRLAKLASCFGGIAINLYKLYDLSEYKIKKYSESILIHIDASKIVAPDDSEYMVRLDNLINNKLKLDGIILNYKVYITSESNALAYPDGSIRIDSGLMDKVDDDELSSVICHEACHIVKKHLLKNLRRAYFSQALCNALIAICPLKFPLLSSLAIGAGNICMKARYSQRHEIEADEYAFMHLKSKVINPNSAISALRKLIPESIDKWFAPLSTHPTGCKRIERLERMLKKDDKSTKNIAFT